MTPTCIAANGFVAMFTLILKIGRTFSASQLLTPVALVVLVIATAAAPGPVLAQKKVVAEITDQTNHYAQQILLLVNSKRDVALDESITSLIALHPQLVRAELKNPRLITFIGLAEGQAIVIASSAARRQTFAIEIRSGDEDAPEDMAARAVRLQHAQDTASGSYSVYFSRLSNGGPSVLRQNFDYRRKLSDGRLLRAEGNTSKFFGRGDRWLHLNTEPSFGLDRLRLGIDTREEQFDLLDSELIISPLSLNGYTIRGPHLVSTPHSRFHGIEFFAGLARPYLSFFQNTSGYVGGLIVPITHDKSFRVRVGALGIASPSDFVSGNGGILWQTDLHIEPNERSAVEGELAYAKGALSWRGRLDLRRGPLVFNLESQRLDRESPLVGIGAQSGRKVDAVSVGWNPHQRFNAAVSYNRAAVELPRSQDSELNNSTLVASVNYNLTPNSRFGFQFTDQNIDSTISGSSSLLRLKTRSATVTHSIHFAKDWTNDLQVGFISSREQKAGTGLETEITLREELRRSWEQWSTTAYLNYADNAPSLANLLLQNPNILSPALRQTFASDPARFILLNRDVLPVFLAGLTLPSTRSTDIGLRLQGAFARFTLSSDLRYTSGELFGLARRELLGTFGTSIRLDEANSVQLSGAQSFISSAVIASSSINFSYTHRFGAGSGGGFRFSRLLGLDHGRIQGRVFFDLNSNGADDPGEPGITGMKVQLDAKHSAITNEQGRFNFSSVDAGEYKVSLNSDDLGVKVRASTPTEQQVYLDARQTIKIAFGMTNFGFISGRVFNDLFLTGDPGPRNAPGVRGVKISIRPAESNMSGPGFVQTVDASGMYNFRDLPPGTYTIEIDPMTFPVNFRLPSQICWTVTVEPLKGTYLDIPIAAQRAIAGVVFRDVDNDGQFDLQKDELVEGARVVADRTEALTDRNGSYLLRNLPAGTIAIRARLPSGEESNVVTITVAAEPNTYHAINLAIRNTDTAFKQ